MIRTGSCLLVLVLFGPAAQAAAQNTGVHVWANVDLASSSSFQNAQLFSLEQAKFGETATRTVTYPQPTPARVPLVAAGILAFHGLGAGVRLDNVTRTQPVELKASVPHPLYLDRFGVGTLSPSLTAKQEAVDLFGLYAIPVPSRWSVRLFAGGTRLRMTEDFVQDFTYSQIAGLSSNNIVKIESFQSRVNRASAWGWHLGADIGFFPVKNVGVGIGILDRQVKLTEIEPFISKPIELSADGVVASVGVRLRL